MISAFLLLIMALIPAWAVDVVTVATGTVTKLAVVDHNGERKGIRHTVIQFATEKYERTEHGDVYDPVILEFWIVSPDTGLHAGDLVSLILRVAPIEVDKDPKCLATPKGIEPNCGLYEVVSVRPYTGRGEK